jgi:hypothetical protein
VTSAFCLADAPNAEAAACVHREAHGLVAEKIIEVEPDVAEVFLGGTETNPAGAVLLPGGAAKLDTREAFAPRKAAGEDQRSVCRNLRNVA